MEKIPPWVKKKISINENYHYIKNLLKESGLHTVCESAICPNIYECFEKKHVTFMILGDICTRNCKFCGVKKGIPENVDKKEPEKIAIAIEKLGIKYAIITSVTRDDLPDGGASQFAEVIKKIKELNEEIKVEVLIPDFKGNLKNLDIIFSSKPDLISHNLETVPSLYPIIRPKSNYEISLNVLYEIKKKGFLTKSGFMLGLGEKENEILEVMKNLRKVNCDFLVIGQYLSPLKNSISVKEYVKPEIFQKYREIGEKIGFKKVFAGTFFRTSYVLEK